MINTRAALWLAIALVVPSFVSAQETPTAEEVGGLTVRRPRYLMIPKIGRYMATIIPPTTVPRTTIISGSIAFRSDSSTTTKQTV